MPDAAGKRRERLLEVDFQQAVVDAARLYGFHLVFHVIISYKNVSQSGFPDLVLLREPSRRYPQGRLLFVELKREGQKRTAIQERWGDALLAAGQEYYTWTAKDWFVLLEVLKE